MARLHSLEALPDTSPACRQLDLDLADLAAPPPPPDPPPPTSGEPPRKPRRRVALPMLDALPIDVDGFADSRGRCVLWQAECKDSLCRHHLGAIREFRGRAFGCAIAVANAYPHGLPPQAVAHLAGLTDSMVQRVEYRAMLTLKQRPLDELDEFYGLASAARRWLGPTR